MSHSSGPTHPSTEAHNATSYSHKKTVEQFADAVNGNHLHNLDKFLDANVQKTIDSQVVYKDLKEAQDYYTKEHANNKSAHWKIIHFPDGDQKENTIRARLTYDNKTYNTTYTFSTSGKIQRIDTTLDANQNTTNIHH
ncbi:unnamed protein product [Rotaria sp. Silwood2]|nr:unnamed protein product [Rotaria sp. Silwood2]CAF2872449.1 unnamed protein product [Rotaria sp. Silwood2]CAF3063595.1 unnamed protein product [Rotaria sp. Silwood2]CAF3289821.1 unnamed protein product [Rotaria sp. Silwood2]CAF4032556.1 unnamed protein product [Rotaria sp. Silwood2]